MMKLFSTDSICYGWLCKQSYLYLQYGKYDSALVLLQALHGLLVNDTQVLKMLCYASTRAKRFDLAQAYLAKLANNPAFEPAKWPQYYLLYSQVLHAVNESSRAQAMLAHYQEEKSQEEKSQQQINAPEKEQPSAVN
ncbi:hypothetical protein [Thalassomonas actiniarum]|uniref:Uncharacterized protein n=1 Tax=Thalassomonas actiniarum TaxID=485447 RepID=A0AAE9YNI2_9GAMM|nr:hypothetical protein [Thalassomonas actiniarum]WDD96626.1 hypothetical protein SG35_014680 [Thalassomonas actiniarum]